MIELLVVIAFAVAIKRAVNDTGEAWKASKAAYKRRAAANHGGNVMAALRHDAGYLLSQIAHGFPQARHGFSQGWHEGRQAHDQARAETARVRAERAETRARLVPEIGEYRARRKAALDEIRGQRALTSRENPEEVPPRSRISLGGLDDYRVGGMMDPPPGSVPPAAPAGIRNPVIVPPTCRHGVSPSCSICDPAARTHSWEPLTGEEAAEGNFPDGRLAGVTADEEDPAVPVADGEPESAPTQGTEEDDMTPTATSDTTYDGIQQRMTAAVGAAEQRGAEIEQSRTTAEEQAQEADAATRWASQTAEQMQALGVDPESFGVMADHLDAADAAKKAHDDALEAIDRAKAAQMRVLETAQNVQATLTRNQGLHQQAHDESPAVAADAGFYGR